MHLAALIPLLAIAHPALAGGTAVWLSGTVDPTVDPESRHLTAQQAVPALAWGPEDDAAIAGLAAEFEGVMPLLTEFDGELQVMRRLDIALEAVTVMREQDRQLIHDARALQGLAAWRYFQDSLATDPDAASVRTGIPDGTGGTTVAIRPWVDAIAVLPDDLPSAQVMPDDEARLAYQQLRATLLIAPDVNLRAEPLPPGAALIIDGVASPTGRARVIPGEHRVTIEDGAGQIMRHKARMESGSTIVLVPPARAEDLSALADALDGVTAVALPQRVSAALATLDAPVTLLVADGRRATRYRVTGDAAVPADMGDASASRRPDEGGPSLRVGISQAWVYDGEYYLLHATSGAPESRATVNAAAPGLHVAAGWQSGLFAASVGIDARATFGQWQYLDTGDADQRLRLHPHVGVGLPWLQATVGADLPWRLGVGARGHVPLAGPVELNAGALWGIGLPVARDGGDPTYEPGDSVTAWLGAGVRLGP